jgi:hypothetical protein
MTLSNKLNSNQLTIGERMAIVAAIEIARCAWTKHHTELFGSLTQRELEKLFQSLWVSE